MSIGDLIAMWEPNREGPRIGLVIRDGLGALGERVLVVWNDGGRSEVINDIISAVEVINAAKLDCPSPGGTT